MRRRRRQRAAATHAYTCPIYSASCRYDTIYSASIDAGTGTDTGIGIGIGRGLGTCASYR